MSEFIEDSCGANGNSKVEPLMTGSFPYRICSICSAKWMLTNDNEKCAKIFAVCETCSKINSLSKIRGEGEHFFQNDSNTYPVNKMESDETSESCKSGPITFNGHCVVDHLLEHDKCLDDFDDNLLLNTNKVHNISASLNTDEYNSPTVSHISAVNDTNGIISELQTVDYSDLVERYVDNTPMTMCLHDELTSTLDTMAPSETKMMSVKKIAINPNENESVPVKTYRQVDPTLSTNSDQQCSNSVIRELLTVDYGTANLDQLDINANLLAKFLNDRLISATDFTVPSELKITRVETIAANYNENESISAETTSNDTSTVSTSNKSRMKELSERSLGKCVEIGQEVSSVPEQNTTVCVSHAMGQNSGTPAHSLSIYTCYFCFQQFSVEAEFWKHFQLHRPDPSEKCSICQKTCNTEKLLQQHYQHNHLDSSGESLNCRFCPYTTKRRYVQTFISHLRLHSGERPYACTQCRERFINKARLAAHVRSAHLNTRHRKTLSGQQIAIASDGETSHGVSILEAAVVRQHFIPSNSVLRNTVSSHPANLAVNCGICEKTFKTDFCLRQHCRQKHLDRLSLLYTCSLCAYTTKHVETFGNHALLHTRDVPYACFQTASAPQAVFQQMASASQAISQQTVYVSQAVSLHTTSALQSVSQQITSVPQAVSRQTTSAPQAVSRQTTSAPQTVLQQTAPAFQAVSQQSDTAPPAVSRQTISVTQAVSRQTIDSRHQATAPYTLSILPAGAQHTYAPPQDKVDQTIIAGRLQATAPQLTSIFSEVEPQSVSLSQAVDQYLRLCAHEPLTHVCSICCQIFADRMEMVNHEQLHRDDLIVKCGICITTYERDCLLREHCQQKHFDRSSLLYTCNLCLYTTNSGDGFSSHVHLHTGEIPYRCTQCEKGYVNKNGLVQHIKSKHQNERHHKALSKLQTALSSKARTLQIINLHRASILRQTSASNSSVNPSVSQQIIFAPPAVSPQTTSARQAVSRRTIVSRHQATEPRISTLPAVTLDTFTSHQDDVNVINGECSLPLKKERESSLIMNVCAEETSYNNFIVKSNVSAENGVQIKQEELTAPIPQKNVSAENGVQIKQEESPAPIPQKTSHQDEIFVLKRECSLSLKGTNESSKFDDDVVNDSSNDDQLVQNNNGEVQCTNLHLKYSSPDLILSRIDDLNSTRKPCSHQCRDCPKIFQHTSDLARHEHTRTNALPYAGKILDGRYIRHVHNNLTNLVKCPKCLKTVEEISKHICSKSYFPQLSNNVHECSSYSNNSQDRHTIISPKMQELNQEVKQIYTGQPLIDNTCQSLQQQSWNTSVSQLTASIPQAASQQTAPATQAVSHQIAPAPQAVSQQTASIPQAVSHQTASAPQALSLQTVSASQAVSQQTVSAPQAVSQQTVSAPQAVSQQTASSSQAVSQQTVSAPQAVSQQTASAPHAVSQQTASSSQAVSQQTASDQDVTVQMMSIPQCLKQNKILGRSQATTQCVDSTFDPIVYKTSDVSKAVKNQTFVLHARVHTGEKLYLCTLCKKRYTSKKNLVKHIKSSHEREQHNFVSQRTYFASQAVPQLAASAPQASSLQFASTPSAVLQQTAFAPPAVSPLKEKKESSTQINDDILNESSDHISQSNIEVQFTDALQKCSTPDLILSRIDDLCNTGKRCCHQCHFCPKIFQHTSALARHERTHTSVLPYAGKILDGRYIRHGHDSLTNLVKCSKCLKTVEDISKHICSNNYVPQLSINDKAVHDCSNYSNNSQVRYPIIISPKMQELSEDVVQINTAQPLIDNTCQSVQQQSWNTSVSQQAAFIPQAASQQTVSIPQAVSHQTAPAPQAVSQQTASIPQAVSHQTASALQPVSQQAASASQAVSQQIASASLAVSQLTASVPQAVSQQFASDCQDVTVQMISIPECLTQHKMVRRSQGTAFCMNSTFDAIVLKTVDISKAVNDHICNKSLHNLFSCSFCFEQFADRREFMKHERLHRPDHSQKCGICKKTFPKELLLLQHYQCKHRNKSSESFASAVCSYRTKIITNFVSHIRVHTGEKPYLCTLCEKRYTSKKDLVKHIKSSYESEQHNFVSQRTHFASQAVSQLVASAPQASSLHCEGSSYEKKSNSCKHCFKNCNSFSKLPRNMSREHHLIKFAKCSECLKTFDDMSKHICTKHCVSRRTLRPRFP